MKLYLFFLIIGIFSLSNCTHNHGENGHTHGEDESGHNHGSENQQEETHEEDEVELTKEQMEKIGLVLGGFEMKNLKSTIKVNGQLELPPQNKASVSAIAPGKVSRIHVKPGQFIKKGGTLASLQNPDYIEWQQSYLETLSELGYLNKEVTRQEELVQKEIAPQKQLDKIRSEQQIAKAKLTGLKSKLQLIGIVPPEANEKDLNTTIYVRSPIAGYVRDIKVNTGLFVAPEQELFEIVDNHHLHIDLMVFEKDIPYIKVDQKIQFSLQSNPQEVMEATIFAIGKALDETQRAVQVHAEIKNNPFNLLPGMYVEARIITENQAVTSLPEEAVTLDKGLSYIFVKEEAHEDGIHFKKTPVLTGTTDFGFVEIIPLETIQKDAAIVTKGAFFLMAQTKKGEPGGGHSHSH